jgi:hypothetical protein
MTRPRHRDERPPGGPGPEATPWRCRCGNLLGVVDRRWLYVRHRRRTLTAALPARARCEDCGRTQAPPPPDEEHTADLDGGQ